MDQVFADLFRSFKVTRPLKQNTAPKWDPVLVLNALTRSPFEPISKAEIMELSVKTLFLVLLASALRRNHIFHLDASRVSFGTNDQRVTIGVLSEFVSKREAESNKPVPHTLVIPALSIASSREDRSLCPVRALRQYLTVTKTYRRNRRRLFLPLAKEKQDFRADALTYWVRKLIIHSHKNCPKEEAILHRLLHEVLGIATSWALYRHVPMSSLMEAAEWKNHNVFTHNYLRDLTDSRDGLLSLGQLVVAQHVV
jgi:hypothetical protein